MNPIERLIGEMSLAEKLGQMTMTAAGYAVTGPFVAADATEAIKAGTVGNLLNIFGTQRLLGLQRLAVEESRLGIPLLIGLDVVHGHRTMFPIPLGEAAAFDPVLWELTARESAREAAADGIAMTFAPMLDVCRDVRWGRGAEGPGEDPWLAVRMAQAKVRGLQGGDLCAGDALAAVAKHYCAYGAVTAGRDYASVDISDRTLHEVYMPPFAAAVAAGVAAVMPAFTDLAGVPMTANAALLAGWLRRRLGFDGVIVSDFNAIGELIRHGIAADLPQAATLALRAGVDIDMMADAYRRGLPTALERGWVSMEEIDVAVRRVLTLKARLGLFEDPYRRGKTPEDAPALAARRGIARAAAVRSTVMLKNDGILPLSESVGNLAVIGPLADAAAEMRGPWWAAAEPGDCVSVVAGLRGMLGESRVAHLPGVDIDGGHADGIGGALELCARADAILLCVGESAAMSGEAASRAHPGLPGRQRQLAQAVFDQARAQRKPVIVVIFSGRALVVPWLMEQAGAVLAAWFPGSEAGNAIADLIMGRVSPSGRTPVGWPWAVGQLPLFYGQRAGGRPGDPQDRFTSKYLDAPDGALFPFGHGLTYGEFALSNLRLSATRVRRDETVEIRVDAANRGARRAEETVFLFTHDPLACVARPLLELKGFAKICLSPGESGTVMIALAADDLCFPGPDLEPLFEPGELEILVGPCADRSRLLAASIYLDPPRA